MEERIQIFPVIKMAVNRKGGLYVHGTKFMNLFRYILIKFYAAGRMKSNCDKFYACVSRQNIIDFLKR